jgi:hypothetical protein
MSNNPKNQHFVPACYLREFVDPWDGFLTIFSRDGKNKRRQKPEKTFQSNHLYTIEVKGSKDFRIEETLSKIEGDYATIFRDKIKKKLPLSERDHITLCIFIAAQLQRTLSFKRNQENFAQQIIEHGEQIAMAHGVDFKERAKWESYKKDIHKLALVEGLPFLTNILHQMSIAFICSSDPKRYPYITSDNPCVLFNPDLQWQRFYGPGFGQKNIQLTVPLSPEIAVLFCWAPFHGYSWAWGTLVEDINRMTRNHCDKEFISPTGKTKTIWFWRVPLDPIFIIKVIRRESSYKIHKLKTWWQYKRYGRF